MRHRPRQLRRDAADKETGARAPRFLRVNPKRPNHGGGAARPRGARQRGLLRLTLPFPTKDICSDSECAPGDPDSRPHPDPSPSHTCKAPLAANGHTRVQRSGHQHPRWPTDTMPTHWPKPRATRPVPRATRPVPHATVPRAAGRPSVGKGRAQTQVCRSCCPRFPRSPTSSPAAGTCVKSPELSPGPAS